MLLKQIQSYVQSRETCSQGDISIHFNLSQDAVESAVWQLEQLGKIHRLSASCSTDETCSNCSVCDTSGWENQWVEWQKTTLNSANLALQTLL
jgi:hypothetical protein